MVASLKARNDGKTFNIVLQYGSTVELLPLSYITKLFHPSACLLQQKDQGDREGSRKIFKIGILKQP